MRGRRWRSRPPAASRGRWRCAREPLVRVVRAISAEVVGRPTAAARARWKAVVGFSVAFVPATCAARITICSCHFAIARSTAAASATRSADATHSTEAWHGSAYTLNLAASASASAAACTTSAAA